MQRRITLRLNPAEALLVRALLWDRHDTAGVDSDTSSEAGVIMQRLDRALARRAGELVTR
jgi:hypothetical protein